jgi:hypothetical protein
MILKTSKILLGGIAVLTMANCSSSSSSGSPSLTTSLNQAVTYMEESLPDVSDGSSMTLISDRVITPFGGGTLPGAWDSSDADKKITMPGGMGGCSGSEPTYNGVVLNPSVEVTVKDYIGMSLDSSFSRCSSGGGASDVYKPTIFGRLSGAVDIIGYLDRFLPRDSSGVYTNGTGTAVITVDGISITVYYDVEDAAVTTYYDKAMGVRGYLTSDLAQQVFSNLMWIRNDDTELNFMFMEFGDNFDDNGTNGSDNVIDSTSYTVMAYNKSTGQMGFEYVSDSASAGTGAGMDPVNPNMEIFRLFVAGEGQEAQITSYDGDSLTVTPSFTAFAVYGPSGDSSTEATASFNYDDLTDQISGLTCVTLPAATASGGAACSGHTNALDISGSLGTAITNIRAYTTIANVLQGKGFQGGTVSSLDWTDDIVRGNYLTDGASVSVGFDTIAELATQTDGTP